MKSSAKKIELASVDDLFSTEEGRQDAKLEKIQEIPLSELHPFRNHPFKVKDDEAMMETADSIKQYGVLVPAIARPDPEGGYELVAGHRRHRASELADKETMPVIVRDLDDDAATIIMVDSNLQRESLLPSERAFAYKAWIAEHTAEITHLERRLKIMAENKPTNRERLREITDGIEQGIKELFESEKYMRYLSVMRISEFCGLTIKDIDLGNRIVNIDHQLQRLSDMTLVIEPTKTSAATRKLPVTEDVAKCFQSIIEDREKPKVEKVVDGYTGFLFLDDKGLPLVAMHWEHRFNHMVKRYNDIYRVQMPNITPHVCRHTYCSNMAKSGMNPKTLQYLMGHSDIAVILNVYTHVGLEDAEKELQKMQGLENARKEMGLSDKDDKPLKQNMFKVV